MYKLLEHAADIGIEVKSPTMENLFMEASMGLNAMLYDSGLVQEANIWEWDIKIDSGDYENLLVKLLNQILYQFEVNNIMPKRLEIITLNPLDLKVLVHGEVFDRNRHRLRLAIKGVTFHQLKIEKESDGYTVKIYFDV